MALTNGAVVAQGGGAPGDPLYVETVSFDLDASYPTGGYASFTAFVNAISTAFAGKTILSVLAASSQGYIPEFDSANDKLKLLVCAAATSPLAEVAGTTNLSAVTGFQVTIIAQ